MLVAAAADFACRTDWWIVAAVAAADGVAAVVEAVIDVNDGDGVEIEVVTVVVAAVAAAD